MLLAPPDTLIRATFQTVSASQSDCSCFTLIHPLFCEYTFFAGLCILFHPSNWVSTILNRRHVYQSQLSLRTALSGVSVKPLDEYTRWFVCQQGLPIFSSAEQWSVFRFRRKEKQGYVFAGRLLGCYPLWNKTFSGCWVRSTLFSLFPSPRS